MKSHILPAFRDSHYVGEIGENRTLTEMLSFQWAVGCSLP